MAVTAKRRVLCIDDNRDECELVRAILTNYEVICVASIAKARKRLADDSFALILIDEHLPDGSGIGLCKQICGEKGSAPVILISGDDLITCQEAVDAGAETFLSKGKRTYVEDLPQLAEHYTRAAHV